MTPHDKVLDVINALESLTYKDLNSLSGEDLTILREKLNSKANDVDSIARKRTHLKTHHHPPKSNTPY